MSPEPRRVRIGSGAGFSDDRIDPAVVLAEHGDLDYLVFECLAERTIALAALQREKDPRRGFDPWLDKRMLATLRPCVERGTRIITNMGAANPAAAARVVADVARRLGITGLRIAVVTGDDVLDVVRTSPEVVELLEPDVTLDDRIVAANAYLGAEGIVEALGRGADVVLTGRVADPSLFVAPLVHEFGWSPSDWDRMGVAVSVGHLLECAGQVTGGYFADPGVTDVPGLADLGFPLADVAADGSFVVTKVDGTGGTVTPDTCAEQILYEVHDPRAYVSSDVVADFAGITFDQVAADVVAVSGARGRERPDRLKVSIGYLDGFVGEGQISYAGANAVARGRLALDVVRTRLSHLLPDMADGRFELIGVDSMGAAGDVGSDHPEVRARVAGRVATEEQAHLIGREVVSLWLNGPAGGGGATRHVREQVSVTSALLPRSKAVPRVDVQVVP
ncbi:acyclic terpene utilization AtuA family protein [Amycolatopsis sp. NPDC098790]|uniref:acyclic terpene utilization AtuA family protein n=1 Tax=Amycolatopsis sp. NPDC098790 TaxID=3363939 RepID=UPI0038148531